MTHNARWRMLGLVFVGTVINYFDRTNMSVVDPLITKECNVSPIGMVILFSAFSWAFAVATLPVGHLRPVSDWVVRR
jgi:ACS family D-galactonate transporter-like MFS transporter